MSHLRRKEIVENNQCKRTRERKDRNLGPLVQMLGGQMETAVFDTGMFSSAVHSTEKMGISFKTLISHTSVKKRLH